MSKRITKRELRALLESWLNESIELWHDSAMTNTEDRKRADVIYEKWLELWVIVNK